MALSSGRPQRMRALPIRSVNRPSPEVEGLAGDRIGDPAVVPHRHVDPGIADVVEALRAVAPDQLGGLVVGGQVAAFSVACTPSNNCRCVGDGVGHAAVRAGRQDREPPLFALRPDLGEQGLVVGQRRRVDLDRRGELVLERHLALQQPQRQAPGLQEILLEEQQDGFPQQIRIDQRAVQVHHQRQVGAGPFRRHRMIVRGGRLGRVPVQDGREPVVGFAGPRGLEFARL